MQVLVKHLSSSRKDKLLLDLIQSLNYNTWQEFKQELEPLIPDWSSLVRSFEEGVYQDALEQERVNWKELYYKLLELDQYEPNFLEEILEQKNYEKLYTLSPLLSLPSELNYIITSNLPVASIEAFCLTSTKLSEYCTPAGWRQIFWTKYPDIYNKAKQFTSTSSSDKDYKKILHSLEQYNINQIASSVEEVIYVVEYLNKDLASQNNATLIEAVGNGHLEIVKYLISLPEEYGIDPSVNDNDAISYAVQNRRFEILKYLISLPEEYGIDPAAGGNNALYIAAINGHLEIVKYLISLPEEYGIDPSVNDNNILSLVASEGHLKIVKYLISLPEKYGVDPAAGYNKPLLWAARNGQLKIVQYLISLPERYGIDPTVNNNEPLREANKKGHLEVVRYLESFIS